MCGRFTNRLTWREIVALYRLTVPASPERNLPARYNICPTQTIDTVIEHDGKRDLVPMRWGLIPSWWKKAAKETPSTFNARAETVAEKPMFRSAFKRNRCLIPASGYYEWKSTPTGKQPYYYTARDGSPLTIAGLWDEWKDIETNEPRKSCTMIVTNANKLASKIHDRMPVLLQPKDFDHWLAGAAGTELLQPASNDYLQVWPVSRRVNSSRTAGDEPALQLFYYPRFDNSLSRRPISARRSREFISDKSGRPDPTLVTPRQLASNQNAVAFNHVSVTAVVMKDGANRKGNIEPRESILSSASAVDFHAAPVTAVVMKNGANRKGFITPSFVRRRLVSRR